LALLFRDHLQDREQARAELRAVLSQDAAHAQALEALAGLNFEDGRWAEAAEVLIKRARVEKTRSALKDIFFRLGVIYGEHLPDAKRAVASFNRVLQAEPGNREALEHLSKIHMKEWDWQGALATTQRLAELEPDKEKKAQHLHRVAKIYEEGFKDARQALQALRQALDVDPLYVASIGELAKFFERQSDVQSARVHLDTTAARVRTILEKNPVDPSAYHTLFRIFLWRRAPDRAAVAAGVLDHLGAADAEEKAFLQKTSRDAYPGSALAEPAVDELLFDARVPAGLRHLLRALEEPLSKLYRGDVKRIGVARSEKLPRAGHGLREVANRVGEDLGLRDFEVYLTAAAPKALTVELTDPISLIVGAQLVDGASEHEARFYLGSLFKLVQCRLQLPLAFAAAGLPDVMTAILRQFVPDFEPPSSVTIDLAQVAAEAQRLHKAIPKKVHAEALPFALECASGAIDLAGLPTAIREISHRAGLLTCGAIAPALRALERLSGEADLRPLLGFAVSEDYAELRRQLGTSFG
jgi:tetratricopeptide (TPR) repeat protein